MARRKRKPRYAKYGKIDGRSRFGRYKRKYNDLLGPALQGMQNLLVTAYHECAHAFCIKYGQNNIDILDRVTILAQDGNLGETHWHDVQGIYTDEQLFAQIVQFMAGRAVELRIFHNAQEHEEDVQDARAVARQYKFCNYVKWRKRKRQSTDCSKKQQKRRLNFSRTMR